MYNSNNIDNSPVVVSESTWSYNSQQQAQYDNSALSNATYQQRFNFNYQPSDAYNLPNQSYQYYPNAYNHNSYSNSNYYNVFNPTQQSSQTINQAKQDEELLKIQQNLNEKLQKSTSTSTTTTLKAENDKILISNTSSSETESNSYESNKENDEQKQENQNSSSVAANNYPIYFTTQKMAQNSSKLSYTVYQLELLNAIYSDMKYPNSVQKTLIAKLIGITRDQVKIWFQNRRRKDTLVSQGKLPSSVVSKSQSLKRRKSTDDFDNNEDYTPCSPEQSQNGSKKQVVENEVIDNVLYQLKIHQNAPSRLSTKRTKLTHEQIEDKSLPVVTLPVKSVTVSNEIKINNNEKSNENCIKPIETQQQIENILSTSNNSTSNPSSFIITTTTSSSSSSSCSSGSSSSEDENNFQKYKPVKFQVLQPSMSIQDYVEQTYNSNMYLKAPKIHNQFQNQPMNAFNQTYQQNIYNNKNNNWNTPVQNYVPYVVNHPNVTNYVEPTNYDSNNYLNQIDQTAQYLYNQNEQAYQYNYNYSS